MTQTPWLLDISRNLSRLSRPAPTGIDRIEAAYIARALYDDRSRFLARVYGRRLVVLDKTGLEKLHARFGNRKASQLQIALAARRYAVASAPAKRPERLLSQYHGYFYVNVGHSNLRIPIFNALKSAQIESIVLVHDTIPLDFPELTRLDRIAPFEMMMRAVIHHADYILTPSRYSAAQVAQWSLHWGCRRMAHVIPPAVEMPPAFHRAAKPQNAFATIGTIEPRKNHHFLIDVWQELHNRLGDNCPELWIIGNRGWYDDMFFKTLESLPLYGCKVKEFNTLSDRDMFARLQDIKAVLFPSKAEGFGLPFHEALALDIPVIASDIPPFCEIETQGAVMLPTKPALWVDMIQDFSPPASIKTSYSNWDMYFKRLESFLIKRREARSRL